MTFAAFLSAGIAGAQIHVDAARIGCLDIQKDPNLTGMVGNACNGKTYCSFKAPTPQQYQRAGVVAKGRTFCTQAMEITFHCGNDPHQVITVPGDAWDKPPAELICAAPTSNSGSQSSSAPQNPQLVPVLQGLLNKYQYCILEGQEPGEAANIASAAVRNKGNQTCVDGNLCSLATRQVVFSELQAQAKRGDPTNFEEKLHRAILNDCFKCDSHKKWHTKQVHCTEMSGGNNGLFVGPAFETCKAGVDISKLVNDVVSDIRGVIGGAGPPKPVTGGSTIATNYTTVDPTGVPETCDPGHGGYIPAPPDLLDWTPTDAPQFKVALTNYQPPSPPTRAQYNPGALTGIGANEGRLRSDLRQMASHHNPMESLCAAAAAFALGNASDGNAFADLSVTGRHAFAAFRAHPPQDPEILSCLRSNPRTQGLPAAVQQRAADQALDRAYRVLGLLRAGGWPLACHERETLSPQYIAVSGEDDQPHRPANAPSAEFPQYDLDVSVPRRAGGPPIVVHTRYMIAHTVPPTGAERSNCASAGRTIPADRTPVLAPNAEVFLYIHGMDSRLEEAMDLTHALHALGRQRGKNYTVISMDLPTSGYADNIDPNSIAPLTADGHAGGGFNLVDGLTFAPNKYVVPVVDFIEDFIVAFVNTLEKHVPVTQHLVALEGGSLGGHMAFRLGRPRPDAPWVTNVIPWSPAAIWPSLADDGVKHAGLAVPWYFAGGDPAYLQESPGARRSFFYGGFDWQSKAAGVIPLGGGRPQAEYWYREGWACKASHMRMARIDRYETYDANFRRWHWRLGMEQLLFSQQNPIPGTNPVQPLYLANTKRMLLMCGIEDIGGDLCKDTRDVAPKMEMTPGHALFLSSTGHSIHNERPNYLARQIADFVDGAATNSAQNNPARPEGRPHQ
jgi:hypothetical protein